MEAELLSVQIKYEQDIVLARQRAREIARALGCELLDQVRIAASVSEIARLLARDRTQAMVRFLVELVPDPYLVIRASCPVPGPDLPLHADADEYVAARRVIDFFTTEQREAEYVLTLKKRLPPTNLSSKILAELRTALCRLEPKNPYQEFQAQNQELLLALADLRRSQAELAEVNRELAETNRGVVALYAELEEKADSLRLAAEEKNRFYSGISHELRTPVHSIVSLSQMLLDRLDGDLTSAQEKQVSLIRSSARDLSEWVDDLLDLARADAGKMSVASTQFTAEALLGAVRGVVRPLHSKPDLELIFEDASDLPPLFTDEGKLTQILRNLVVNALKFTEVGEVRVRAEALQDGSDRLRFTVVDTGVGIAPEDQDRIFEEFVQVDGPVQRRTKGTGLGLPLSKRLATLLGGCITLVSEPGFGSEFGVVLPRTFGDRNAESSEEETISEDRLTELARGLSMLIVDDDEAARYLIRSLLSETDATLRVAEASSGEEGLRLARRTPPDLILLDWRMPGLDGAAVLQGLRETDETRNVATLVCTSHALSADERSYVRDHGAGVVEKPSGSNAGWVERVRNEFGRLQRRRHESQKESSA